MTRRQKLARKVLEWEKKVREVGAVYSNSKNKIKYTDFLVQNPSYTNCALGVSHALQYAGCMNPSWRFYADMEGNIKGCTIEKLSQVFTIYNHRGLNKTTKDLILRPGDVILYYGQHTNMYLGKVRGRRKFVDWGRGTNINHAAGYGWKSAIKYDDNSKTVAYVLRVKKSVLMKVFPAEEV